MRTVVQRVKKAKVLINDKLHAAIEKGLLIFIGIENSDQEDDLLYLSSKICNLRIFADNNDKLNLNIIQTQGDILVISQFTLFAEIYKGNRPSFLKSAQPEFAIKLYEKFISEISKKIQKPCFSGKFGANMEIDLVNDGPVTIIIDSKNK